VKGQDDVKARDNVKGRATVPSEPPFGLSAIGARAGPGGGHIGHGRTGALGGRCRVALLLCLPALPAAALDLALPVDCTLGADCYIQQLFDHDPGPGVRDFACGTLSYDGHDGTDFALPTLADMDRGVHVLAAAAGTVRGLRDGMPDIAMGSPGAPDIAGRECGNGVVIRHADGWETQYCHLRQGSVRVVAGETVAAGTVLGEIGLSGRTEFPHLHFALRRDGVERDPFAPDAPDAPAAPDGPAGVATDTAACAAAGDGGLWIDPPPYRPGGVTAAGFAAAVPDYAAVRAGTVAEPPGRGAPALVLWALMFGGRAGDLVELTITGPEGPVLSQTEPLDRPQALFYRAAGRRTPAGGWPAGRYTGTVRLLREGIAIADLTVGAEIP
jgi:hypothetical protein